jgi:hypothetical protein
MSRIPAATLTLAIAALAVGGCGGSSKSASTAASTTSTPGTTSTAASETPSGTTPSGGSWVAQGDAICKKLRAQLSTIKVRTEKDYARVIPVVVGFERAQYVELLKVVPPADSKGDWQQFLAAYKQWTENTAKIGEEAEKGKKGILSTPLARATSAIEKRGDAIARKHGFQSCTKI